MAKSLLKVFAGKLSSITVPSLGKTRNRIKIRFGILFYWMLALTEVMETQSSRQNDAVLSGKTKGKNIQ